VKHWFHNLLFQVGQLVCRYAAVEQEEECVTNTLMKKLEKMNSEKREMMMRVEQVGLALFTTLFCSQNTKPGVSTSSRVIVL
jgi:hypothetical protein